MWEMKKTFRIVVSKEKISFEAYSFYREDLEDLLRSESYLEKLPNPFLFETMSYVDDKGCMWVVGMVLEEETRKQLYEIWIRDGEPIAYELYVE
jgi:hypothetical protein